MKSTISLLLCAFLFCINAQAQIYYLQKNIKGTPIELKSAVLAQQFANYQLLEIKEGLAQLMMKTSDKTIWELGDLPKMEWELSENDLIGKTTQKAQAPNTYLNTAKTYEGFVVGGGKIRLTLNENFIYGFWEINNTTYFIEPAARFLNDESKDLYVVYEAKNAHLPEIMCTDGHHKADLPSSNDLKTFDVGGADCKIVEIAMAADYSMYESVGENAAAVSNYTMGGVNNAEALYEVYNIEFDVSPLINIITEEDENPWDSSNSNASVIDSDDMLEEFAEWGPSGLPTVHDIGVLWTGQNIDSGAPLNDPAGKGRAYIGTVCEEERYALFENAYLNNAVFTQVLIAHEFGHNFGAQHNIPAIGGIMDQVLSDTDMWSAAAFNAINDHIDSRTCLASCACLRIADVTTNLCVEEDYEVIVTIEHFIEEGKDFDLVIDGVNYPQIATESPQIITIPQDIPFGTIDISLMIEEPDDNTGNCIDMTTFNAPKPNQTFDCLDVESGVFIADWQVFNEDEGVTIAPYALGNCNEHGDNVLRYNTTDFSSFDNTTTDILQSFAFDLSDYVSADLTFDLAYKQSIFINLNTILDVRVSTDCGGAYTSIFDNGKTAEDLATVGGFQDTVYWEPTSCGEWRTELLDLSPFVGASRVVIQFELSTGQISNDDYFSFGPALFLDNICFNGQLACAPPQPTIMPTNLNICGTNPAILTASNISSNYPDYGYQWFKSGNVLLGENSQELATYSEGVYTVQLVDNAGVCPSPFSENIIVQAPIALESGDFCEDMESGDIPMDWRIDNLDGAVTFDIMDNPDCSQNEDYALRYESYENIIGANGTTDILTTQAISLNNYTDANLTFDLAYSKTYLNRTTILDIAISEDCGATFTSLYNKTEDDLASVSGFDYDYWKPNSCNDWKTETVNLDNYVGENILIRFSVIIPEEWGQNLYLDNICIEGEGCVETMWYRDADDDNFGDASDAIEDCEQPNGYVSNANDCNDGNSSINPATSELCGNNADDDCNGLTDCEDAACIGEAVCQEESSINLSVRIFLQGNYNEDSQLMGNALQQEGLLPSAQPYNTTPWNYSGNENASNFPTNTVDWVLVEVRSGTPAISGDANTILVETKAGLLQTDGDIVDAAGNALRFDNLTIGADYHILVRHRNHLDVISAQAIQATSSMNYDFTTAINKAFGASQQVATTDGKAVLYVGDYTPDGVIQNSDNDAWKELPAILSTYYQTDGTLDGIVQVTDQDAWLPNKAKIGTIEVQF